MSRIVTIEVTYETTWTEEIKVTVPDGVADLDVFLAKAARDSVSDADPDTTMALINAEFVEFEVLSIATGKAEGCPDCGQAEGHADPCATWDGLVESVMPAVRP